MPKFRYPAPFDPKDDRPIEVKGAPEPPTYCGPPLPVDIPVDKVIAVQKPSLYKDLFGTDLSMLAEALDATWASEDQRSLASEILCGEKSINALSTQELELLDDLVYLFNGQESKADARVRQAISKRLRVPEGAEDQRREEAVHLGEHVDVQFDVDSDISGAYGWAGKDGD